MTRPNRRARAFGMALLVPLAVASCSESPVEPLPPEPEPEGEPFHGLAVALTATNACAVDVAGRLHCWGLVPADVTGDSLEFRPWAMPVPDAPALETLTGGDAHFCGLAADSTAWCWGDGASGRLGAGTTGNAIRPTPVAGSARYAALSAGGGHTCAVEPADTMDAAGAPVANIYCWGRGLYGEIGDGQGQDRQEPTRVGFFHRYVDVAAGRHHTCGVTDRAAVRCWGWNHQGQLGVGHTIGLGFPEGVSIEVELTAVTAGDRHSCAIDVDGGAWCWGRGTEGQLGTGGTDSSLVPRPVPGGLRFRALSAGTAHTCGVTEDDMAYCWGERRYGRVGDGLALGTALEPSAVAGDLRFHAISAGEMNSCGITTDDAVYCWGHGGFGQLGSAQLTDAAEPLRVRLEPVTEPAQGPEQNPDPEP